jgi:hypothetical protein
MLTVRMIDSLSSDSTVAGRVFTARLRDPLMAPNGTAIAPAGAIVTGRVMSVRSGERPQLTLSFDTIETYEGVAGIDTRAERTMNAPFDLGDLGSGPEGEGDVVLVPMPNDAAFGGGPRAEDAPPPTVRVPYDTEIDLVLTKTLVVDRTR